MRKNQCFCGQEQVPENQLNPRVKTSMQTNGLKKWTTSNALRQKETREIFRGERH